ncbi:MAG: hypothetical protein C4K48_08615 [Candidatus Thorarchaeota archaeon]|nr:MAG: hypothetical protein C4K48_08615 [Candidatus Thorarchaeota archaeon]
MTRDNDDGSLRGKADIYRTIAIERRRSMKLRDNERVLIEVIRNLDTKHKGLVVIVEGKRDAAVLQNLGLKAPIVRTQSKLLRYQLIEQIVARAGAKGQVLILTDYDQAGEDICSYIEKALETTGVRTLKGVRIKIRKLMGNWRFIEELVALFKRRDSPENVSV